MKIFKGKVKSVIYILLLAVVLSPISPSIVRAQAVDAAGAAGAGGAGGQAVVAASLGSWLSSLGAAGLAAVAVGTAVIVGTLTYVVAEDSQGDKVVTLHNVVVHH
ncbi:MAG: hypothetical protein Q8P24_19420 [Desulfobacterales bacterium]|nr:hypothetical protein [Desulfobacterales bacterium]